MLGMQISSRCSSPPAAAPGFFMETFPVPAAADEVGGDCSPVEAIEWPGRPLARIPEDPDLDPTPMTLAPLLPTASAVVAADPEEGCARLEWLVPDLRQEACSESV
jgi:hypothetical protein